jgi:hypothetical protein
MEAAIHIAIDKATPAVQSVLKAQGVPESTDPGSRTGKLAEEAIAAYRTLARPVGMFKTVTSEEFARIWRGEGKNEPGAPLEHIYSKADYLALCAVTIGEQVGAEISRLFDENLFAEGAMLDAAASEGTELAADALQCHVIDLLHQDKILDGTKGVLRFSPGYCGWHVSAQKQLFTSLEPDKIGIGLSATCLMYPLKSISGVIAVGPKSIFDFPDDFPFCETCRTHDCRDRIRAVMNQTY